jgi:hypothetical protein
MENGKMLVAQTLFAIKVIITYKLLKTILILHKWKTTTGQQSTLALAVE